MKNRSFSKRLAVSFLLLAMYSLPLAVTAQTGVTMPKNKYKVQDDVKIGNQASAEIEKQFPMLNDDDATRYVERVGERLVSAIPEQFRQPSFDYRFRVVNASDINAFALPGGPMFVNRGMIEAARNEGEMAGVMAHEISHVALRHATAQQTKQGSIGNQLGMLGMILGGAILAGPTGAQLGAMGAAAWMTKYSRAYETQADVLGAQIMANAGYDPRDLANMFRTISQTDGARAPEWLSSHPDPGNRYANINREAALLRVSPNPIKITRDFERVQARLRAMPRARTLAEIQKSGSGGSGSTTSPTARGRYSQNVPYPSSRLRAYSNLNYIRFNVPSNWREFPGQNEAQFAPEGAYGEQGLTHGLMVGLYQGSDNDLGRSSQDYINGILQANSYLRQRGGAVRSYVGGRPGYAVMLAGRSPVTNRTELVTIYTTQLNDGNLVYLVTISPDAESGTYSGTFRGIINSVRIMD